MGDGGWWRHRGRRNSRKFRLFLPSVAVGAGAEKIGAAFVAVELALDYADYATRMPCLFLDNNSCSRFGRSLAPSPRRSQPWFMKSASRAASEAVSVAASTQKRSSRKEAVSLSLFTHTTNQPPPFPSGWSSCPAIGASEALLERTRDPAKTGEVVISALRWRYSYVDC